MKYLIQKLYGFKGGENMAYQFFMGFEISKVIFTFFLTEPYIFFIINRKNVKFQIKKKGITIYTAKTNLLFDKIFSQENSLIYNTIWLP